MYIDKSTERVRSEKYYSVGMNDSIAERLHNEGTE